MIINCRRKILKLEPGLRVSCPCGCDSIFTLIKHNFDSKYNTPQHELWLVEELDIFGYKTKGEYLVPTPLHDTFQEAE